MRTIIFCLALSFVFSGCSTNIKNNNSNDSNEIITKHDEILKIMRDNSIDSLISVEAEWISDEKRSVLRKMKADYFYQIKDSEPFMTIPGPEWKLEGPLSMEQLEQDQLELTNILTSEDDEGVSNPGLDIWIERWNQFKGLYKNGDEFYHYSSDTWSWSHLRGREGYVLIRDKKVIYNFTTVIN